MFAQSTTNKSSNNQDKLMELGRMYLNEKGVDSAPTNFNKRTTSTSQNQRGFSRGTSQEMDRNAITAKFNNRRGWMIKDADPKCFLSFY